MERGTVCAIGAPLAAFLISKLVFDCYVTLAIIIYLFTYLKAVCAIGSLLAAVPISKLVFEWMVNLKNIKQ